MVKLIKKYWLLILMIIMGGIATYYNNIEKTEFTDDIDLITPIPETWEP